MAKTKKWGTHPYIPKLIEQLENRKVDRREFLRTATLLGMSSTAAYGIANGVLGDGVVEPALAQDAEPKMGGILRCSMEVQEMTDPATFDWGQKANVARHIGEFLTYTGPDNVTRPYLAERWEASDDLTSWTLYLRQGIQWHNGDAFNADDVVSNFVRWLDPKTGSSNQGLFSAMTEEFDTGEKDDNGKPKMGKRMREGAVEKVDDYTVRIHMNQPVLSVPENLSEYTTMIVHRDFEKNGADLSKWPMGTGPYTLSEFVVGEKALLKKVDGDYWGKDLDDAVIGGPIYLDEIHYFDHGSSSTAQIAAVASDQVDMHYDLDIASLQTAESIPESTVYEAVTAQTAVMRFRQTEKPFDDRRVRRAVQLCAEASRFTDLVFLGRSVEGEHHHVAPIHPEYAELPKLERDIEEAKRLLAEAGYPDGIELSIDCGNTPGPWEQQCVEILKEQCAEAGIIININIMPANNYWEIWDKTPFGITHWAHRPLGTMVLSLAYRSGVPWNESGYASAEFDAALDKAESLVDVEERKAAMEDVERMLQDDAVLVQAPWIPALFVAKNRVKGLVAHPTRYHQFHRVWIDA